MAAVTVAYALNQTGNLDKTAPKLADDLDKVADAADKAKDKVDKLDKSGSNFSARALEMGSSTLEMAGAVLEGVKAFIEGAAAAKEWMDSVVQLREALIDQGRATKDATQEIEEYADANKRLNVALEDLQLTLGEELAPAFTDAVNAATGLLRLLDDMGDKASGIAPDFDTLVTGLNALSPTAAALLSSAGAVGGTLAVLGQAPNAPFTPNQGLVLPPSTASLGGTATGTRTPSDAAFGFGIPGTVEEMEALLEFQRAWADATASLQQIADDTEVASDDLQESLRDLIGSIDPSTSLLQGAQTGLNAIGTGSVSGVIGMAGGLDPVTGLIMDLIGLIKDPQALFDLFAEVLDTYLNLDDWISDLVTMLIDQIIALLPEMAAAFVTIGPAVALALVEAAPQLFAGLIDALFELPRAFAQAVSGLLSQAGDALNPFNDGLFSRGGALATHFGSGRDSFLGIGLGVGSFDTGGMFNSDGLAYVHKGEVVLNQQQQRAVGGTSIGAIHIHMHGVSDIRRLVEELQNALGSYGLNVSLSPRVG